jgi:hypothetical protein
MSASCFSRYLIVFAALTISFSAVQSQQPNRDPRQQAVVYRLPNMDQISVQRDITFKNVGDLRLKMDVYYPADVKKDERRPVVIFIDGVGNRSDRPNFKDWGQYRDWGKLVAPQAWPRLITIVAAKKRWQTQAHCLNISGPTRRS